MAVASPTRWIVVLLLAASCAVNAWLYRTLRHERAAAAARAAASAAKERAADRCEAEMRAPLANLIRELGGKAASVHPLPLLPQPRHDGGVAGDPASQTLCDIGREQAKQRWMPWKEDVGHLMRWYLADQGTQERKTVEKVADLQRLFGLSSQEGYQILDEYAPIRRERVAEVRRLMDQEPADWGGVFDQIKGLQSDEDALVQRRLGPERARQVQEVLRNERLLLLSVLATYADRPWDDAAK